jgi:hypothetical protein
MVKLFVILVCVIAAPLAVVANADGQQGTDVDPDTTALELAGGPTREHLLFSPLDTVTVNQFHDAHAFSLDNFLERSPRLFMGRLGPIGAQASFSRYSMGRGRGATFLGRALWNDPQTDAAALAMFPTSAFGEMIVDIDASLMPTAQSNLEGAIRIVAPPPPTKYPSTFIEVSRGDRDLNQRRVRFATVRGPIGLDFGYDELRDSGYYFDARGLVPNTSNFGSSSTRVQSLNLRGELPYDETYLFAFRKFQTSFQGDLVDPTAELRRHGHLGVLESAVGLVELAVYDRGWTVTAPDSITDNETLAFTASVPLRGDDNEIVLAVSYEDIFSKQEVGGGESKERLQKGLIGMNGRGRWRDNVGVRFGLNLAHQLDFSTAWGGHLNLVGRLDKHHSLSVLVRRGFRMPNLGELFLPDHNITANTILGGNRDIKPESGLEGAVRLYGRYGGLENELQGMVLRMRDPILYQATDVGAVTDVRPQNSSRQTVGIISDKFRWRAPWRKVGVELTGGVEFAAGDRDGYFTLVPRWRGNAALKFGRSFFKDTSATYFLFEYQYTGERTSVEGQPLNGYNVLNIKINLRLIDAHIYVQWLNVLEQKYVTVWPYRMTPRTFVDGIQWTFFD